MKTYFLIVPHDKTKRCKLYSSAKCDFVSEIPNTGVVKLFVWWNNHEANYRLLDTPLNNADEWKVVV